MFSSFQLDLAHGIKDSSGETGSDCSDSTVAYTELVCVPSENDCSHSPDLLSTVPLPPSKSRGYPSPQRNPSSSSDALIRRSLRSFEISDRAKTIIQGSWRQSTWGRYDVHLQRWQKFCCEQRQDPLHPTVTLIVNFLQGLYEEGLGYNALCQARSALNAIFKTGLNNSELASHQLVTRFLKGVFQVRPPFRRPKLTWNLESVLNYLDSLPDLSALSLKMLSYKLVGLLMLLSASRVNTIHAFSVTAMSRTAGAYTFHPTSLLKHSRPGFLGNSVTFHAFPQNRNLCIVSILDEYLKRRALLTDIPQLIVTHRSPHKGASSDTIARWLKELLTLSGIDTSIFKAHSFRGASSSYAHKMSVPLQDIMSMGQWSQESTWTRFYNKTISAPHERNGFGSAILQGL